MTKKKIFVITGEPSGDVLAYKVIKNLDIKKYDISGIVGEKLKKLKIKKCFDNSDITFFWHQRCIGKYFFYKKKN